MIKLLEFKLLPKEAADADLVRRRAISQSRFKEHEVTEIKVIRRSIDARASRPFVRLRVKVYAGEVYHPEPALLDNLKAVKGDRKALIVGAGPAGYFAALELIEKGIKPIVFERGKDVRSRRYDLRAIQQLGLVNPQSNYCFGEGGAGTYSDGKLYTRSHKRGDINKAMRLFVEHGAKPEILIDAHPHIGSNKLPGIVANIRETIKNYGGEIHFNSPVTDLIVSDGKINGILVNGGEEHFADAVILATGHSARDIYKMLYEKGIPIEAKAFALGVRIEHPQSLIDKIQYGQFPREAHLPASSYRLACQVAGRGVFSFCMCPGGMVVPTATAAGEIVVNGMSLSRRDSPYANSGTVVAVEVEDLDTSQHPAVFSCLEFQKEVERAMFDFSDGSQKAPGQRLTDFVDGKISAGLPGTSYIPGLISAPLHELLPSFIYKNIRAGVLQFEKKMPGYFTGEANVIATESRTSSPVRIPRGKQNLMHEDVEGLFPCGEGAGYAGGIISAAVDGQNVARAIAEFLS